MNQLAFEFVISFPDRLEEGTLYVSMEFASACHLCCCGCGERVVTPISPVGWELTFDGDSVSLSPSIGSWSLPCRSHYFIHRNQIRWTGRHSRDQIDRGRRQDRRMRDRYFAHGQEEQTVAANETELDPVTEQSPGFWRRLRRRLCFWKMPPQGQ